jgi:hypothetical protein
LEPEPFFENRELVILKVKYLGCGNVTLFNKPLEEQRYPMAIAARPYAGGNDGNVMHGKLLC